MNPAHAEPIPTLAPRTTGGVAKRAVLAPSIWAHARLFAGLLLLSFVACKPDQAPESNLPAAAIPAESEDRDSNVAPASENDSKAAVDGAEPKTGKETDAVATKDGPEADSAAADGVDAGAAEKDVDDNTADQPAEVGEKKLLILGDSMAATGFGVLLQKKLDGHPQIRAFRKGKSASGLARPDYFDWMEEAKRQIELREPDIVVVIMGGNDGQDLTPRKGQKRVNWQTAGWDKAYGDRMDAFLAAITAPNRRVVWLGLPHMEMRSLEKKLELIREIQRLAIERYGASGAYVDTTALMADADGNLPREVRVKGRLGKLREEDGIHFTMSGSEFFADRVYPEVLKAAGIE